VSHYSPPPFIDNLADDTRLLAVLQRAIRDIDQRQAAVATGYFDLGAWELLREDLRRLERFRLLLGVQPDVTNQAIETLDLRQHYARLAKADLEAAPLDLEHAEQVDSLIEFLRRTDVEVRLYRERFLHAKAYLFPQLSIVGSSNLTRAGLTTNAELDLVAAGGGMMQGVCDGLLAWFDHYWESADPTYEEACIEVLEASKFGGKPYTPYQVFIKALHEYFRDRLDLEDPSRRLVVDLAVFQHEGFREAVQLLERHGGVLVADAVGLGKSFIGVALLEHYLIGRRRRGHIPKGLIVCPAQLREMLWEPLLRAYQIRADIVSQELMGRDEFPWRRYTQYDFVLVDESHNFRNPGTVRYQNLYRLLTAGKRSKKVALVTATPVNNTIYDLYHQVMLLARGSDAHYRDEGIPNLRGYFRDVDRGAVDIFDLLEQTTVRRSRADIRRRQEAGERIEIEGEEVRFPERSLRTITYDLTGAYPDVYHEIVSLVEALELASYNVEKFRRRPKGEEPSDDSKRVIDRSKALIGIQKTLFLKRLESSVAAFKTSVTRQREFQRRFYDELLKNRLLAPADNRKLLALQRQLVAMMEEDEEGDEDAIRARMDEVFASLEPVSVADYDLRAIREAVKNDVTLFDQILQRIESLAFATDVKCDELKRVLRDEFRGQKVLIFSYYHDTAMHVFRCLTTDQKWLAASGHPVVERVTGDVAPRDRNGRVRRFAPASNRVFEDEPEPEGPPIQILVCTDVLSEGQNLQDCGIVINYDLHWNPVRMIQRAGRVDRLRSLHEHVTICNFFPEEGLEELLRLVQRLYDRLADIDRTVGLDTSVLGEAVSGKSLSALRRLRAEDESLWRELEEAAELASGEEMKLPLLQAITEYGQDEIDDIPFGIHSGKVSGQPGVFMAFSARGRHYWRFYPEDKSTLFGGVQVITDKRRIFAAIASTKDEPRVVPYDRVPQDSTRSEEVARFRKRLFELLDVAISDILREIRQGHARRALGSPLGAINERLFRALSVEGASEEVAPELLDRLKPALRQTELQPFRREADVKHMEKLAKSGETAALAQALDEFLATNMLYEEVDEPSPLEGIRRAELRLVCYMVLMGQEHPASV